MINKSLTVFLIICTSISVLYSHSISVQNNETKFYESLEVGIKKYFDETGVPPSSLDDLHESVKE